MTSSDSADYIASRFIYLVHRGESASTEVVSSALTDLELNGTHGLMLEVLGIHPGISAAQLARYCRVSRQAVLVPLGLLESRGLVSKTVMGEKARVKPLALTAEGARVAALVRARVAALEAQVVARFSEGERELLRELLGRYAEAWDGIRTAGSHDNRSID